MRALVQRVKNASVKVGEELVGSIEHGILVFLGVKEGDNEVILQKLCAKVTNSRIFSDENGKMNLSVKEVGGDILLVSQFTLYANISKGNRPSFIESASPAEAERLYEKAKVLLESALGRPVQAGKFGADMKVSLVNDGPVTIMYEF